MHVAEKSTKDPLAIEIIHCHNMGEECEREALEWFCKSGVFAEQKYNELLETGEMTWDQWVIENLAGIISKQRLDRRRQLARHWDEIEPLIGTTIRSMRDVERYLKSLKEPPPESLHAADGTVHRKYLLRILELVKAGLSPRGIIEQSSCFVFTKGKVVTYNDEVYCTADCDLNINGAVYAETLLRMLRSRDDRTIQIEQDGDKVVISSIHDNWKGTVISEGDVRLPFNEVKKPRRWKPLHEEFCNGVNAVARFASKDASNPVLCCVHLHPKHIEAGDASQFARFPMKTGISKSALIRGDSIQHVAKCEVTEYCETKQVAKHAVYDFRKRCKTGEVMTEKWLHFRNAEGMTIACRVIDEPYLNGLDKILQPRGLTFRFPEKFKQALSRVMIVSVGHPDWNFAKLTLQKGKLTLQGEGPRGSYEEQFTVDYNGPKVTYIVDPKLLMGIPLSHTECRIAGTGDMHVDCEGFEYVMLFAKADSE